MVMHEGQVRLQFRVQFRVSGVGSRLAVSKTNPNWSSRENDIRTVMTKPSWVGIGLGARLGVVAS